MLNYNEIIIESFLDGTEVSVGVLKHRGKTTVLPITEIVSENDFFDGHDIWDVMMSIGLEWGDMDLFHWRNHTLIGDQSYFMVWTLSDPGYFIPEWIASGEFGTDNVVFSFSIPRSDNPEEIYDVMYKAASYTQSRLGGKLYDENGEELDINHEKQRLSEVIKDLRKHGIEPGTTPALMLF